jgi:hypothetical protein
MVATPAAMESTAASAAAIESGATKTTAIEAAIIAAAPVIPERIFGIIIRAVISDPAGWRRAAWIDDTAA